MSTTIESLQIEVQSGANSAVEGIDALSSTLNTLKSATKGGVGLTAVSKQLTTLNNALNGISGANADNLNKLSKGLQMLSSCGNLKLSSSVATQITAIGGAVRTINGTNFSALSELTSGLSSLSGVGKSNLNSFISQLQRLPQAVQALNSVSMSGLDSKLTELVSTLSQLSNMGKNNLTSFVTQLNKIPKLMENLKNVDMKTLYNQIQSLVRVFTPLATQMEKVSAGFAAFPTRIQKLIQTTDNLSTSNNNASKSYVNLAAKISIAYVTITRIARVVGSFVAKSNEYVEDLNLFTASMGKFAGEAKKYAENVAETLGIDPAEWLRNQGVFMTLATGFGVVSDRAYTMSQNLTQLGYDISSFFNISFADSMQKLQSGVAGELEPLRRLGYDLSVARLQQEALNLGISESVNKMTQAEKAELRYYAIMTQVTVAQGDMARTLIAPANQLRILQAQVTQCARALGNIFIPALNMVLPYAIAFTKIIRMVSDVIANLFGFSLPEIDYSSLKGTASGAEDVSDSLDDATKKAKEFKKSLLGIDELNILSASNESDSSSGTGSNVGTGLGFELPTYDFLGEAVNNKIDEIVQSMKEWLGITDDIDSWAELFDTRLGKILLTVGTIGLGFAAWKIAKGVATFIETLSSFKGFDISFASIGSLGLLSDLNEFVKYFKDFVKNGGTFQNVTGMISSFTGAIGDAMIVFGNIKIGGALKVAQGIGEIFIAFKDVDENGINWNNVNTAIRGLTNVTIGIGVFTGNIKVAAWGVAIQGFSAVITEIGDNWDAIKKGDWSGVDTVTLVIGVLEVLGGLAVALDVFSKLKSVVSIGKSAEAVKTVSDTVSTSLSPNLTSLAKNLGMGLVIIAEVAAAALLITGAIALLGMELEQVGLAWQPVIDNAGTVAIAMGIGTALLVVVGVVTGVLGSVGTGLIVNLALGIAMLALLGVSTGLFIAEIWAIGWGLDQVGQAWQPVLDNGENIALAIGIGTGLLIAIGVVAALLGVAAVASAGLLPLAIGLGTAMLLELGAAAGLFIAEIWAIGKGLDEVGKAWQPVLDNGDTIKVGIETGTALLIAIGVVTAALGVASVASVGLLPLAIGLGTALLVELGDAVVEFNESLVKVARSLGNRLQPELNRLNDKLPTLTSDMKSFTRFMKFFAGQVVDYSESSAISGLASTVGSIIDFFTEDPIDALSDDAYKQYKQSTSLNKNLRQANPELESATLLMKKYYSFLEELERLTGKTTNISLANGMFVNMKEVGKKLITGFVAGINSEIGSLKKEVKYVFGNTFSTSTARSYGYDFGTSLANGVSSGFRNMSFPCLTGNVDVTRGGSVSLQLQAYAAGGFPDAGQLFFARESGPEMVGSMGSRTTVANNDQIVEGIQRGVADGNAEQVALIKEQNRLLREQNALLSKGQTIGVSTITQALSRKNQRDGRVVVSVGT